MSNPHTGRQVAGCQCAGCVRIRERNKARERAESPESRDARLARKREACRKHRERAKQAEVLAVRHADCLVCLDIDWLLRNGVIPEQIAERMGYVSYNSLHKHVRDHGKLELARKLTLALAHEYR